MVFLVCRVGWGIPRLENIVGSLVGSPGAADDWSSVVSGSRRVVGRVLADGDGRWECGIGWGVLLLLLLGTAHQVC